MKSPACCGQLLSRLSASLLWLSRHLLTRFLTGELKQRASSYEWKCVCTTGAISDEFHQWDGEVDCRTESDMLWPQLRLRLWPTAAYTTLQHTTLPSRSHNGNAKKSMVYGKLITPQRKLAQLTCLRWIYLGSNEAKCGQVTNASEASRNHFISARSGRGARNKGRSESSTIPTLMAGSHAKCSGASCCLQQNKVNLLR